MPSSSPIRRHITAGLAAAVASMSVCAAMYYLRNSHLEMDWSLWFAAMAGYGALGGVLVGLAAGIAERRGAGVARTVLMGASAGVVPGILGVFGFGSLNAPYCGTGTIVCAVLAGAAAYAIRMAPSGDLGRRSVAGSTAVIVIGSLGVLLWLLVTTLGLIPSFDVFRSLALDYGLWFAAALGAGVGAAAGAFIVMASWLDGAAAVAVGYDQ
jgi:hypothetical protein